MKIKRPTLDDIELIAQQFGLELSVDDLASFQGLMEGPIASYERLDELVEPKPAVKYPRTAGYRPEPAENPLGAWYYKCSITGARNGRLKGRTVAVKDNVCVAGV
ncbi:MAG: amidase, partial [Gammaproteobacteria bacterium]